MPCYGMTFCDWCEAPFYTAYKNIQANSNQRVLFHEFYGSGNTQSAFRQYCQGNLNGISADKLAQIDKLRDFINNYQPQDYV